MEWQFSPSLAARTTYTDNVNQSHSDPQDALILSVTPGFSLRSKGSRRVQAAVNYSLTGVARFSDNNSTDLNHNLGANGKAELIEDFLFLDGSASISQELISLLGSPADATTNADNRATVGSYSISPYIQKRFGTFAQAMVRYTSSGAIFQNDAANNINSNRLNASLASGTQFNDLSWGLNYSLRDATIQGEQDVKFEHYGVSLGYGLTRHVRAFGTLGYDKNDYASASGASISGRSWTAGLGWSPNRRTSVDASFGNTYFGRTYGFNLSHRTHNSTWTAGYNEGTSDFSQLLLNTQPTLAWNCKGTYYPLVSSVPPAAGCFIDMAPAFSVPTSIANGIFISKTLQGGVSWSKGKSSLGLNVFDTRRQYQQLVGLPEDETRGISATYGYRLQPHTMLNASLGYTNTRVPAGLESLVAARDDDLYTASLGVSHQFDAKLSGALTLRRQQRESNDPASSFDENSISASALMRF
ncbi:MAG: TIGR03016 family PEP-CTERM system-associated outer membrane protein [Thiobacillus sp.]